MKIPEVVRGQVAELFGRFRPAAGLSAEEVKGVAAERQEFASRVAHGLQELQHPQAAIVREFRRIIRELRNEPAWAKMPTPEGIVGRVRSCLEQGIARPTCPACDRVGGSPGFFANSALGPKLEGQLKVVATGEWWCGAHYEQLAWYWWRHLRFSGGRAWTYPVPRSLLPRETANVSGPPSSLREYTDGALISSSAIFVREYLERVLGEPLREEPCPTATSAT